LTKTKIVQKRLILALLLAFLRKDSYHCDSKRRLCSGKLLIMTTPEDSENDSESPELESENGSQSDLEVASEPWKLRCERLEQRVCCTPWVFLQFLNPTENEDQEAVDR